MLRIPASFEHYGTLKDKSMKLVFETIEPTPDQVIEMREAFQTAGYLVFSNDNFTEKEIDEIKSLRAEFADKKKSPSQRLREVFFKHWETNNAGFEKFEDYYDHKMELVIKHYKSKLP